MEPKLPEFGRFAEPSLLILVSLTDGPKHGYAIMEDVERGTGRPMGAGTLYAALVVSRNKAWSSRSSRSTGAGRIGSPRSGRRCSPSNSAASPNSPSSAFATRQELDHEILLIRCYPARWRARYGDEFGRSSTSAPSARTTWRTSSRRPRRPAPDADGGAGMTQGKELSMSLRIGGIAAILGGGPLGGRLVLLIGCGDVDDVVPAILLIAGRSAARGPGGPQRVPGASAPVPSWAAFAVSGGRELVSFVGIIGMIHRWRGFWGLRSLGSYGVSVGAVRDCDVPDGGPLASRPALPRHRLGPDDPRWARRRTPGV